MLRGFSSDILEGWARVCCVHGFLVILLILTHVLSYQDDIIVQSLFLRLFAKVVGWFWIITIYGEALSWFLLMNFDKN